ncbi:MAG: nickel-responsive transcriptional regulator NikR [Candidatus Hadarchaeum sp.]|uniref:nickel-responsive transcriptional regulator NikR n=1 Tax=Candidatus Hadarchaeum sp. TaxID=2883567 RepID=UPI003D0D04A4
MAEKITRISLTLPQELLKELDESLKSRGYASRSEAVRDALRNLLSEYKYRKSLEGHIVGVLILVYEHDVRGLADAIIDIQHSSSEIINTVQHIHLDQKNCLETSVVKGPAEKIEKIVERLESLRGVKQAKLMVIKP